MKKFSCLTVTKTLVVNEISDKFCTVLCVDLFNSIKDKGTVASNIIEGKICVFSKNY